MTDQVLLSISGLQFMEDEGVEQVEVVTVADYYRKENSHYLIYDEVLEGIEGKIKNIIKVKGHVLEVTKKGLANVHMVFEENKKNVTYYTTPFGNLLIGLMATSVDVNENDKDINIQVAYQLEVNYEFLADCTITMNIKSKEAGDFSLQQ